MWGALSRSPRLESHRFQSLDNAQNSKDMLESRSKVHFVSCDSDFFNLATESVICLSRRCELPTAADFDQNCDQNYKNFGVFDLISLPGRSETIRNETARSTLPTKHVFFIETSKLRRRRFFELTAGFTAQQVLRQHNEPSRARLTDCRVF